MSPLVGGVHLAPGVAATCPKCTAMHNRIIWPQMSMVLRLRNPVQETVRDRVSVRPIFTCSARPCKIRPFMTGLLKEVHPGDVSPNATVADPDMNTQLLQAPPCGWGNRPLVTAWRLGSGLTRRITSFLSSRPRIEQFSPILGRDCLPSLHVELYLFL